jgi:hypothetical protein
MQPFPQHPLQPFLNLVFSRQARSTDLDFLFVGQYGVEMPVAGELPAAGTDTAAADRTLGITDTTAPLHQDSSINLKALPRRTRRVTEEIKTKKVLGKP